MLLKINIDCFNWWFLTNSLDINDPISYDRKFCEHFPNWKMVILYTSPRVKLLSQNVLSPSQWFLRQSPDLWTFTK